MPNCRIAPSILSADFARLGEDVQQVIAAGADIIHVDVMDNHFVPNLTMGPMICSALRDYGITVPIDVHLMISPTDNLIPSFAKAGADIITIHAEATQHLDRSLQLIRDHGCKAGVAFNPATPLNGLAHILEKIDLVLIMSVNPGFGGQQFIASSLEKINQARAIFTKHHSKAWLEVDGGINQNNIAAIAKAGADTFVAGSAIFNSADYLHTISNMRANCLQKL